MKKHFGTDGVRGIANTELNPTLTFSLAKAGGYVINKYSHHDGRKPVAIIGTDTRISKDMLKTSMMAGLMSTGINIIDCGIIPTPAIAYLTRHFKADIGVVISASHNPMEYNGIKFFNSQGLKLADSIEKEIEDVMDKMGMGKFETKALTHNQIGRLIRSENPKLAYMKYLAKAIDTNLRGLKVVLDTANGAAYNIAPKLYKQLKANVTVVADKPNGININWQCGSTHIENVKGHVLDQKADIGLAYDGDADRLIAVDEKGETVDGDQIMMIIANYLKKKKLLKDNKMVVTVMSNLGLRLAAEENDIDLSVTKVGDRYVLEEMLDHGYTLGGEQSGHIILLDYNTTGDGILSSLLLCKILKDTGKKLSELKKIMTVYPQVLVNVNVDDKYKTTYQQIPEVEQKIKEIKEKIGNQGRILIRPSGTEPLIRVMMEGKEIDEISKLANELASVIADCCKN